MAIVKTDDAERLMKRCQIGVGGRGALETAHDIMAECYGTIGALVQERDMLRTGDTCARMCEATAYRVEARQLRALLIECAPYVLATAEAEHLLDGFRRQERSLDGLANRVRALMGSNRY